VILARRGPVPRHDQRRVQTARSGAAPNFDAANFITKTGGKPIFLMAFPGEKWFDALPADRHKILREDTKPGEWHASRGHEPHGGERLIRRAHGRARA